MHRQISAIDKEAIEEIASAWPLKNAGMRAFVPEFLVGP
jgi:hypothetical protein